MSTTALRFAHEWDARDTQTFLQRAKRLGCGYVRLQVVGEALVTTVPVREKQGLLDTNPLVLGVRVCEVGPRSAAVDRVVEVQAVLDRLARDLAGFELPVGHAGQSWAAVTPPRDGWIPAGTMTSGQLETVAKEGIEAVAGANGLGIKIVDEIRRTTWSREIVVDSMHSRIPAGAALAAFGLGQLPQANKEAEQVAVSMNGPWIRLSTSRGHVLTR